MKLVRCMTLLLVIQSLMACAWAADSGGSDVENKIKAAYLLKFPANVEWPADVFAQAQTPFTIGVVGADAIATALIVLSPGHLVNNRIVQVKQLKPGDSLSGVQMLYIGEQDNGKLRQILGSVQSQPVLTVSQSAGALDAGSVINFVLVNDRIRFEVSVTSAKRNGLKISTFLLGVAQRVEGGAP